MATRQQNIIRLNKEKGEKAKRVIIGLITGLTSFEYKKPSGEWNVSKLAKDAKLARDTVYKYLAEYESNL